MKRNEVGYVVEQNDDITKIKLGRHSECKNCGACPGNNNLIVSVNNTIGAKVGDKVCVQIQQDNIVPSVYIVYIQPLLLVFMGSIIGYLVSVYTHKSATVLKVVFGAIFFIISIIFIKVADKKAGKRNNLPTIIKIIS
ncbi:SoxR reducing system RseC family protein [Terrisporobacter glycolicus]|uniref:Positive regulator of sigma(E), RseC/MucC n=1 Tax=Terrisporobacter glycolicus ATCC 14880 = DSM 1288 TaxID=1121315 RepID=A0ABZ2ETZ6_9FIRM|nr:SoxR reducing system RseC family protein [Terrisporobacter glycolicus]